MKIAHLTYDMRIGGTESVILNIILNDINHNEHQVLCLHPKLGPFAKQLINKGISVSNFDWEQGFKLSIIFKIRQYCLSNNIDILHCHQYTPWSYGALACLGISTKVIFTEHGRFYPDIRHPKRRWINPFLSHFTHKVTAISNATKQALVEFEYIPTSKIDVIYNGLDNKQGSNANEESIESFNDKKLVFGTIARFDPIKNHKLMIEAFSVFNKQHEDSVLLLVGDGETRHELTALVSNLGLVDKVIFTGYIENTRSVFGVVDIFLLTSFSEGTSMTLLESMQNGVPSIVTEVGGNTEIVIDNVTGITIANDSKKELVDAMISLSNPETRNKMGNKALQRYEENFTALKMVKTYNATYQNITI